MAEAQMETETLYLPLDIVQASPGFTCDFGGSMIKVIYRCKTDFCDGEAVNKEAVRDGAGRVHLARIPRMLGAAPMIDLVTQKCDLKKPTDGVLVVPVTGIGTNLCKQEIESKLNIRLQIIMEDTSMSTGFKAMHDHIPGDKVEFPPSEEGMKASKSYSDFAVGWFGASGHTPQEVFSKLTVHELPPGDKPYLPCLIVNTGSGHLFMVMTEKGELLTIDGLPLGAKTMINFAMYCLGKKDFGEVMGEIEAADGATCDLFWKDMIASSGTGNYNVGNDDFRAIYMGKLEYMEPDHVKKADLAQSMFRMGVGILAQVVYSHALTYGLRKIYFTGGFVYHPLVRKLLTMELQGRVNIKPQNQQIEYHFMRYGGYCGALGAFVQGQN